MSALRIEDERDLRASARHYMERGDALAARLAAVEAERDRLRSALEVLTIECETRANVRAYFPRAIERARAALSESEAGR